MIVIDDIELSKNIVDVKEVFIIRVLCHKAKILIEVI